MSAASARVDAFVSMSPQGRAISYDSSEDIDGALPITPIPQPDVPSKEVIPGSGIPYSVYEEADPATYLGPRGKQTCMTNAQGLKLKAYFWPAENPVATLVMVHGHGAHLQFELLRSRKAGDVQYYAGSWVERMNQKGITVCGIDSQGCGRSEGLHGIRFYVENFDDYVRDCLQFSRLISGQSDPSDSSSWLDGFEMPPGVAGLPTFVSGISLGGCIAFTAALRDSSLFDGSVFLAPMLSLEKASRKGLNPYLKPLAALLSYFIPTAAIVATDRNVLYPDIQALWDADPLCSHGKTRVRNASEYLRATDEAMASIEKFTLPFFIAHSEFDTMTDCDGSKALFLRSPSTDKTLRLKNDMWHVLMKEKGNEHLCQEICEWIVARSKR